MTFLKYWSPFFIKIKVYILNYFYERVIEDGLLQGRTICNKKKGGGTNQGRGRHGGGKGRDKVKQNMICMYENAE